MLIDGCVDKRNVPDFTFTQPPPSLSSSTHAKTHRTRIAHDSRLNSSTKTPPSTAAATGARQIWLLMLMLSSL
jgi:hypothetical protein